VCALGDNVKAAQAKHMRAVARIHWNGEHHRSDIAIGPVQREAQVR